VMPGMVWVSFYTPANNGRHGYWFLIVAGTVTG